MKITILDDYQSVIKNLKAFQLIKNYEVQILHQSVTDEDKLVELLHDTSILVLTRERTKITKSLLSRLPQLRLISQTGKVSNHINVVDCTAENVAVAEGIGSPIAPAELTWALLLNTVRQIPQEIEAMKQGKWQIGLGDCIYGKTIGIWGYGKIGQRIAQFGKVFGAQIMVWGSESSRTKALADGFVVAESKEYFFEHADIISLHLRLNESTKEIVKQTDLERMKPGATIINTARAELVEKNAIYNVLKSGKHLKVGVDVYETEPIYDSNYDLLQFPTMVCTPHIGYVEKESYELYFGKAFENVVNFINGNPTNIANPEVL